MLQCWHCAGPFQMRAFSFQQKVDQRLRQRRRGDEDQQTLLAHEAFSGLAATVRGVPGSTKRRYRIGSNNKVSRVELTNPPMTTMARGRWISESGQLANYSGTRPKAAMDAVIMTGRRRRLAPSSITSPNGMPMARS